MRFLESEDEFVFALGRGNPRVVLRTREEVSAWLLEQQLASVVELSPLPGGEAPSRT